MADAFSFVVINDLHYVDLPCKPWLEGLVGQINSAPGVELVLVLGDLAELGTREELMAAKGILDQLRVPYYVVPGNHDGPPGRGIDSGAGGLAAYMELFPGRRNYSFTHKGWRFIGLDTTNGSGWEKLPVTEETRQFARECGQTLDPDVPTILFTHFPLDPTVPFSLSGGYELLDALRTLNLRIVFSGHYHGLSENVAPNQPHVKLLTNRCVSRTREVHDNSGKRGYFTCRANGDESVSYRFVEYTGP